jgi:hypothetical protein
MKQTLNRYQVATALRRDEYARWSADAALALADYYIDLDEDCDTDTELDVVAIRCTWSECDSLKAFAEDYRLPKGSTIKAIKRHLDDNTRWRILDNGHVLFIQF